MKQISWKNLFLVVAMVVKKNKTASTVYLKHLPSGMEIKCQESRSREDNRYFARERLCDKVHTLVCDEKTKEQQRIKKN